MYLATVLKLGGLTLRKVNASSTVAAPVIGDVGLVQDHDTVGVSEFFAILWLSEDHTGDLLRRLQLDIDVELRNFLGGGTEAVGSKQVESLVVGFIVMRVHFDLLDLVGTILEHGHDLREVFRLHLRIFGLNDEVKAASYGLILGGFRINLDHRGQEWLVKNE